MSGTDISSASNITRSAGTTTVEFTRNGKEYQIGAKALVIGNDTIVHMSIATRHSATKEILRPTLEEKDFARDVWKSQLSNDEKQQFGLINRDDVTLYA